MTASLSPDHDFTVGDLEPDLSGTLLDGSPGAGQVPVDLTDAAELRVHILRPDKSVIARAGSFVEREAGTWAMQWEADDLAEAGWRSPGRYLVEVQVMWPGNRPQTFGPAELRVRRQIA